MSLIGQRCKCSNVFSWLILISRKLDLKQAQCWPNPDCKQKTVFSFQGIWKKVLTSEIVSAIILMLLESNRSLTYKWWVISHPYELVLIVMRVHLFPSRTQKLSSFTPTIVAGRLAVKIGNANTKLHIFVELFHIYLYLNVGIYYEHRYFLFFLYRQ